MRICITVSQVTGDIKAELVNGKATMHDLAGRLELSSVNGGIDLAYNYDTGHNVVTGRWVLQTAHRA